MTRPEKDEIVALALALEEVASPKSEMGVRGLKFMCATAAHMIRRLHPEFAFKEEDK